MEIGYVEDGIYWTERISTVHFFRRFGGYGISFVHLMQLWTLGASRVRILEHRKDGSSKIWWSHLKSWLAYGEKWTYDGDLQRILQMGYMWEDGKEPYREPELKSEKQEELFSI